MVNYQQTRYRRRTCKPPAHFVKKRVGIASKFELTKDNKKFLDQYSVDHFNSIHISSPLKEEPWPRNEFQKGFILSASYK